MSTFGVETFLAVPRLTPERRLEAVRAMTATIGADTRFEALQEHVEGALQAHTEAVTLARRWATRRSDVAPDAEAVRLVDAKLDRAWTALHTLCVNALSAFEPGSDPEAAARCLLDALFPRGPAAVTTLPYIDQHAALSRLVDRTRTERSLIQAVQALSAGVLLDRIDELNQVYGESLTRQERISFDAVLVADRQAWRALTSLVARALGLFPAADEGDEAIRRELLGPLREQEEGFLAEQRRKPSALG